MTLRIIETCVIVCGDDETVLSVNLGAGTLSIAGLGGETADVPLEAARALAAKILDVCNSMERDE